MTCGFYGCQGLWLLPVSYHLLFRSAITDYIGRGTGYPFLRPSVYLTIIPRARVGYEMIDSQRGA